MENIQLIQNVYRFGIFSRWILSVVTYQTGFYLFGLLAYLPYIFLNSCGIYYGFLSNFFIKLPCLIGDILIFYSLYEIAYIISHDSKKCLTIVTIFFLNPYSIYATSIIGHPTPLVAGFISLSLLYLLKGEMGKSAACLALSMSIQFVSAFLLPGYLIYTWKSNNRKPKHKNNSNFFSQFAHALQGIVFSRFFKVFLFSSIALLSPYIYMIIVLYFFGSGLLFNYLASFLVPVSASISRVGSEQLFGFAFNFTYFFNILGLAKYVAPLMGYKTLVLLNIFIPFIKSKKNVSSSPISRIHLLNQLIVLFFSTFALLIPLGQSHYFAWFFPFILLEAYLFSGIPAHYPLVLSTVHILIDPVQGQNFYYYFDVTYPWLFPRKPTGIGLAAPMSGIYSVFLLFTIFYCLFSNRDFRMHAETKQNDNKLWRTHYQNMVLSSFGRKIMRFLSVYFDRALVYFLPIYLLLEVFRVADKSVIFLMYLVDSSIIKGIYLYNFYIGSLFLLILLPFYLYASHVSHIDHKHIFDSHFSKIMASAYISVTICLFGLIGLSNRFFSPILIFQIMFLSGLCFINKDSISVRKIQLFFFIFYTTYVFYGLLSIKDTYLSFLTFLYVLFGSYVQIKMESNKVK